ncbi:MAG: hypothetical protein M0Q95_01610 [Porticoccaceae bacterium]|nr:hypothetical protein [Porticoccaceae bacterium]
MNRADRLKYFHGNWPTNKGAWYPGEKVRYREMSLFDDFSDQSWMTLCIYGITGKMPSEQQAVMVEKLWSISTSFPDPRLWNNRIAALAGTTRTSGVLAIAAATAVSEAKIYGAQPLFLGAQFLHSLLQQVAEGGDLESLVVQRLKKHRYIPGFGRPIISKDERIDPLLAEARKRGFGDGHFVRLVFDIDAILVKKRYRIKPNIAIYCAAIFSDIGFSPRESYLLTVQAFTAGMFPCYVDAMEKPEGTFFPIECTEIHYKGVAVRRLQA